MLINPKQQISIPIVNQVNNDNNYQVNLKHLIKRFFLILVSMRIKPLPEIKIDFKKIENVLILRNDGLGDYVLTTPLIKLLKKLNPKINIDIIASHRNNKLIEYDNNIRNIFSIYHKPSLWELYKLSNQIKKYSQYDLMIASKHTKITNTSILFNLISKKAIKIGFKIASSRHNFTLNSYKLTFHYIYNGNDIKYYKMLQEMLKSISMDDITFEKPYVLNEKFTFENRKTNNAIKFKRVLINISGFEKPRIFNEDYIVKLKNSIISFNNSLRIVFTSSPEQYFTLDNLVQNGMLNQDEVVKYDIIELIKELPKFDIVITPDTAVTHFAFALNIPQIIFYDSKEKYIEWSPEEDNYVALIANGNINQISIAEFKDAFKLLETN